MSKQVGDFFFSNFVVFLNGIILKLKNVDNRMSMFSPKMNGLIPKRLKKVKIVGAAPFWIYQLISTETPAKFKLYIAELAGLISTD
jgi:hypothetical protein